jgi:hypothetical protein
VLESHFKKEQQRQKQTQKQSKAKATKANQSFLK